MRQIIAGYRKIALTQLAALILVGAALAALLGFSIIYRQVWISPPHAYGMIAGPGYLAGVPATYNNWPAGQQIENQVQPQLDATRYHDKIRRECLAVVRHQMVAPRPWQERRGLQACRHWLKYGY